MRDHWVAPRSKLRRGVVPDRPDFSGADLCAIAGVSAAGLSAWRRAGLLPPAPETRRGARYPREVARRACAIGLVGSRAAKLRRFDEMMPLILDEAPPRAAAEVPVPVPVVALPPPPMPPVVAPPPASTAPPTPTTSPPDDEADIPGAAWRRIELLPGLELHLAAGAPPVLRALVRDIARRFGRSL